MLTVPGVAAVVVMSPTVIFPGPIKVTVPPVPVEPLPLAVIAPKIIAPPVPDTVPSAATTITFPAEEDAAMELVLIVTPLRLTEPP